MRKVDDGEKKRKEEEKKRMTFLVATTSLPAVYRPNGYARTKTAGTPHARAKRAKIMKAPSNIKADNCMETYVPQNKVSAYPNTREKSTHVIMMRTHNQTNGGIFNDYIQGVPKKDWVFA